MSTIQKLQIQGIRSFGAKAEDLQSITFESPVTLILGENGCGKTTIIECLKYALTGEAPPGSDRGRNFVHDPKIFSMHETNGQIKLQVKNVTGESISIVRAMKICMKRGKFTFETTDNTINYPSGGHKGDSESISKRCLDVDTAMCQFMGVSKSIINSVLFCHQEDSSWPLDEGKKLKEKFDAIFDITEYNKAIDHIIKMRKQQALDLKLNEGELRHLEFVKKSAENKTMELQKFEQKSANLKAQCDSLDNEMKPVADRISEICALEYECSKYRAIHIETETKRQNLVEQIANMRKKIKNVFVGSIDELDSKLREFINSMEEKKLERDKVERNLALLRSKEKDECKKMMDFDKERCILQEKRKGQMECNEKLSIKIKMLCEHLNIEVTDDLAQKQENVPKYLEKIKNALVIEQNAISVKSTEYEQEDEKRQTEIDEFRIKIGKLEQTAISSAKQKTELEKEEKTTEAKIKEVETSSQRLKKITEELEKTSDYFQKLSEKFDQEKMRESINSSKEKVKQLQAQYRKLDDRLTFLNAISKQTSEIALKEKELEKKEQDVRRVKNKHSDNLRKVIEKPIEQNYHRTLQAAYENLRREIKDLNEKANKLKLQEHSYEIERKNLKEEITRAERELEDAKEKIYQKCHSTPYEELLTKSKAAVAKYQLDHGALRSAEAMYKMYIQKIEEDPCCPLCHKNMSNNEATDVTSELTDEIQLLPEKLNQTDRLLKAELNKYESLLKLQPVIEKVASLEAQIPKCKEQLKQIQAKLSECTEETETMHLLISEPTAKMELANTMLGQMTFLDEAIKDVTRLKEDIDKLKKKLPQGSETDVSIEDLQFEKNTVAAELENERSEVEKKQQTYEKTLDGLNKLRETINTLKDEQFKLQESLQSLPQLKERREDLLDLIDSLTATIVETKHNIEPLKQKLNAAITEKQRFKDSNRNRITQMQTKFNSYKNFETEIQRLTKEMKEYQAMNLIEEIERLEQIIKSVKERITELTNDISKSSDKLEDLKMECLNQETTERNLKDNREIKVLQKEEIEITAQCDKLSKQLDNLDFCKLKDERNELTAKREKATIRKGELLGQIGEINNQINNLKKEMDEPEYKNSVRNYRAAFYDVEVTRRVINDLGKYRTALEWSIMQFHAEKMEKINRLIREYWRLIYRGNDIDYIEIKTESDPNASADRRRSYNYRVIQSKNNTEIEMRGRCSAGQRVLASLIIRMALAETFSSNCGVLALDEPTTNLDHNNILSLCEALNRIVDDRRTQANFMLIIITHDENFIQTLGKITSYHRVFRNHESKSVIRKVKVG